MVLLYTNLILKKNVLLVLILFVLSPIFSLAQDIKFDHLGLDEGLSQSSCISICKDSYGFYWLGTEDGLNRFDGKNITIYKSTSIKNSLSNDRINYLHTLWDDFVLISTNLGVDIYQHSTDRITKNALNLGVVTGCVRLGENYFVGNEEGVLFKLYQKDEDIYFERYASIKKTITKLELNEDTDELFIGTIEGALKLNLRTNQQEEIFFGAIPSNEIIVDDICILNSNVFFAIRNYGIFKYNSFLNPAQRVLLGAKPVSRFLKEDQVVWMAGTNFLAQFKEVDNNLLFRTYEMSSRFKDIRSMYKSKDGEVCIGTYDNGFYKLRKPVFSLIEHSETPGLGFNSNSIWGFRELHKDSILVIGDRGIETFSLNTQNVNSDYKLNGKSFKGYNVQDLIETDSCYWVATFTQGLFYVDKRSSVVRNYRKNSNSTQRKICSNQLRKIFIDSKSRLWVGSFGNGISIIDLKNGKIRNYQPSKQNNIPKITLDFYEFNDKVYLASFIGLLKYENRIMKSVSFKTKDGRTMDQVLDINPQENGLVWLSTTIGLYQYDLNSETILDGYTVTDGLLENTVYGSVVDDVGNVWISSNHGLAKVNPKERLVSVFDEYDGLQSREFNGTAFAKYRKNIFFGGINGANYFNPDSIVFKSDFYPIYFQDLNVNFMPFYVQDSLGGKQINFLEKLVLDYTQNTFSIDCIIPGDRGQYQYQYRLIGYDENWIDLKRSNNILYRHLPSGDYLLEVRAYFPKTNTYSNVRHLAIKISSPFWMKTWFWITVFVVLIILVVWYVYSRIQSQKRQTKELKQKVDERTHELKQALKDKEVLFQEVHHRVKNNLQLITSLLNLQAHSVEDEKALEAFEKSKDRIRSMALVHTKLYQNQESKSLNTSEYLTDLFLDISNSFQHTASVEFESHVDKSVHLSVETSVKLGLIVTELYINAFKYGFEHNPEPKLSIWLEKRNSLFWLKVKDNGPGFNRNHDFSNTESLGREIVDALVEQLNGELKVYNDNGANIEITFEEVI